MQYVIARALLSGSVRMRDFEGDAYAEPEILRLLQITNAQPHPDMLDDADEQWGAEVIVWLKSGRVLLWRVNQLVGRGDDSPMTRDEMWAKSKTALHASFRANACQCCSTCCKTWKPCRTSMC